MKTENDTPDTPADTANPSTTFNTWARVADDQMQRAGELFTQGNTFQAAAWENGRELMTFNLKLAHAWQSWVAELARKVVKRVPLGK